MTDNEDLNPHFRYDRRKIKRIHNKRARLLRVGNYALGCRGHPGVIVTASIFTNDFWGSDIQIKSLVDDIVESCSIMHCAPTPLKKDNAIAMAVDYPLLSKREFSRKWNPWHDDEMWEEWELDQRNIVGMTQEQQGQYFKNKYYPDATPPGENYEASN